MPVMQRLCGEIDPENDGITPVVCDFLRGHPGKHSWQMERDDDEDRLAEDD